MGEVEEFNTLIFEKKLMQLKDTQESIQSLSSWCLKQREHHKKIVQSWLNVLKRVKIEQRLVLFYLANDVIQYSKRKSYEFVESWGLNLQKATPLVRDEKVRPKILRIFKIWEQRNVYDEEFLSDLNGLISVGANKKTDDDSLDFQPQQLVNKIKQCSVLEADTDLRLKYIHESSLELSDADALLSSLKDRSHKDDIEKELNEGIACVERYTQALQREIVAREALLALLTSANQYYSTQRGEVKVVAYAYKNFGARVRALKRKLDDLTTTLPKSAPSPPQRDEDVPSPGPDEDLDLPINNNEGDDEVSYNIDKTFNTSITADGSMFNLGLSSFLTSENPLSMFNDGTSINLNNNANKIEVINTRPEQDFNINDILKTFTPSETKISTSPDRISVASGTLSQHSQDALPGLDLLTPDSTGHPPPPTSFYGTMDSSVSEDLEPYRPEMPTIWSNSWNMPAPQPVPPVSLSLPSLETPESPPPSTITSLPPPSILAHPVNQDLPSADVDHRGILPPPPPPPVLPLLGNMEDVDHRLLPSIVPPPTSMPDQSRHQPVTQDVDHRNLISLTHQPPSQVRSMSQSNQSDQDYRVPTMVPPPDIVESVDMDLSDEEEEQRMYSSQQLNPSDRRNNFNNNKVLVGGTQTKENVHLVHINSIDSDIRQNIPMNNIPLSQNVPLNNIPITPNVSTNQNVPVNRNVQIIQNIPVNQNITMNQPIRHNMTNQPMMNHNPPLSAPIVPTHINLFETMPPPLSHSFSSDIDLTSQDFEESSVSYNDSDERTFSQDYSTGEVNFNEDINDGSQEEESVFDEDLRLRGLESSHERFGNFNNTNRFMGPNHRFPRNWSPRPQMNFRPQFRPWTGPRPPNRWIGPPRPQRFW